MNIKEQLISVLEIAEINFLMSLKELKPEFVNHKAVENVNTIAWIVGHCVLNFDRFLSLYTNEQLLTKDESEFYIYGSAKESVKDYSLLFVKLIDIHLELTDKLFKIFEKLDATKFDELPHEQAKGKLCDIIKSMSLHVMGHTGQIVLLRRMLDNPFWSFVQGVSKENRQKLRKEWLSWWGKNKLLYQ
ncbi:MAG: DinB family protein [Candidatus Heimdallarchaeota archaeon]|nr:DinB family protein [Candidatus Heimdallarchaeota archaeon]